MRGSVLTDAGRAAFVDEVLLAGGPVGIGRRFGVLSLVPGGGTSTVAALVARAFARVRAGRVLLARTGAESSVGTVPVLSSGAGADPARLERLPLEARARMRLRDGVFVLDASGADPEGAAVRWQQAGSGVLKHFDVTVVDWPAARSTERVLEHALLGHATCLVTPSRRDVAERTLVLADMLRERGREPVVVFVDRDGRRSTWPRKLAAAGAGLVEIPHRRTVRLRSSGTVARCATVIAAQVMRASEPPSSADVGARQPAARRRGDA